MVSIPRVQPVDNRRQNIEIVVDILERRHRLAPQLPLQRPRRRPRPVPSSPSRRRCRLSPINALRIAPLELVPQQAQKLLLQRLGRQTRSIVRLAALDQGVAPEQLRDARKRPAVDPLRKQALEQEQRLEGREGGRLLVVHAPRSASPAIEGTVTLRRNRINGRHDLFRQPWLQIPVAFQAVASTSSSHLIRSGWLLDTIRLFPFERRCDPL